MTKEKSKLYATLFVRPKYETGTKAFWVWELILFAGFAPKTGSAGIMSCGNLVGAGRFGSQDDAIKKAEHYADLLNIEIDRRSLIG